MFSLQAQIQEEFQTCVEFLSPSATILGNENLLVKLKNESLSLKVYSQKSSLKEKEE
jgi:hypothetical protein